MSRKTRTLYLKIAFVLLIITTAFLYVFLNKNIANHLVINEIAFSHSDKIDWIELYNPTLNNLSLKGLYLSDNAKNYTKFEIKEDVIVPSGGFVVIYCNGYEGEVENSVITNFRIANGETVYLVAQNGAYVMDYFTAIEQDNNGKDISIGRFPDGSDELFIMSQSTPGTQNQKDMLNNPEPINQMYEKQPLRR